MIRLYNWLLPLLLGIAWIVSRFSPKLRQTLAARADILPRWQAAMTGKGRPRILFHVASVGELEQARAVLEGWRARRDSVFLLSFFSPSVRNVFREFDFVDYADYLPLDRPEAMAEFFRVTRPDFVVLNRYDIWPNFVREAEARRIPIALINVSTPPLGWFGRLSLYAREALFRGVSAWTFVDGNAAGAWDGLVRTGAAALVAGDPRVDRALTRVQPSLRGEATIAAIRAGWEFDRERTIVAGSTWGPDEELLLGALADLRADPAFSGTKLLLVPHELERSRLEGLRAACEQRGFRARFLSELGPSSEQESAEVLIGDVMGVLAELYGLGSVAYVGGGFGRSVHSVIEPAAHGLAIAFGPNHERMPEARTLALMGGGFVAYDPRDHAALATWFRDSLRGGNNFQKARDAVGLFIKMHKGAGERVAHFLEEVLDTSTQRVGG